MRRVVCTGFGEPLRVEDVEEPSGGPGRVVVAVRACGVNYVDALIVAGRYQIKPPLPFVPGGEASGVVVASGDETLREGDRVVVYSGMGAFASTIAVPSSRVIAMPDGMSFEDAAAFPLAYSTALYGLRDRGALQAGETLLVLGASGGTGMAALDVGKAMGARTIAAASTADKLAACDADERVNYTTEDLKTRVRELTGGRGADVVFDPVGGEFADAALRATAWGGRYLVIGFVAGIPQLRGNMILLRGCDVVGVDWGAHSTRNPDAPRAMLADLASMPLHPRVTATYPLERASDALDALLERRVVGKAVLTTS